jgi:hypothetical protein
MHKLVNEVKPHGSVLEGEVATKVDHDVVLADRYRSLQTLHPLIKLLKGRRHIGWFPLPCCTCWLRAGCRPVIGHLCIYGMEQAHVLVMLKAFAQHTVWMAYRNQQIHTKPPAGNNKGTPSMLFNCPLA